MSLSPTPDVLAVVPADAEVHALTGLPLIRQRHIVMVLCGPKDHEPEGKKQQQG